MWRMHVIVTVFQQCSGKSREERVRQQIKEAEAHVSIPKGNETMTQLRLRCWGSGTAPAGSKR